MRFFAFLFAITAWSSQAEADYHSAFDFSEIASVHVQLVDTATGACWTNLKEVREYAEEKFRIKGVKIVDKSVRPNLYFSANSKFSAAL